MLFGAFFVAMGILMNRIPHFLEGDPFAIFDTKDLVDEAVENGFCKYPSLF